MSRIESHHELLVWQKAMDLAVLVYELSARFPSKETYRLVAQITRSASSVPANIAEGKGRATARDFANFVAIAEGSLMETETYVVLSTRLEYTSQEEVRPILDLIT